MGTVRVGLLMACSMLSACSWLGRGTSCREPAIPANPVNQPALKAPPGLDEPDTRNAVRVPDLNEPERPRGANDPCLSAPPSYGSS